MELNFGLRGQDIEGIDAVLQAIPFTLGIRQPGLRHGDGRIGLGNFDHIRRGKQPGQVVVDLVHLGLGSGQRG